MFGFKSQKTKKSHSDKEIAQANYAELGNSLQDRTKALMEMRIFNHATCVFILFNASMYVKETCQRIMVEQNISSLSSAVSKLSDSKTLGKLYHYALDYAETSSDDSAMNIMMTACQLSKSSVDAISDGVLQRFVRIVRFLGIDACMVLLTDKKATNMQGLLCGY